MSNYTQKISYGKQDITETDIKAVIKVLNSDWLTQGPTVPEFEKQISNYVKVSHTVAVNSATSALHLACIGLEITKGDIVWTSDITFVASANCAKYCGADVEFLDIEMETYNICIEKLSDKLEKAKNEGRLPKLLIVVHLAGQSCDMKSIHTLSKQYNFRIIEDASHAIGGKYEGNNIGSCQYSDATIFSFHPVKIITTAEGGCITTNDIKLAEKLRTLRSHGITRKNFARLKFDKGPLYYEQNTLGYNYRMSDIHAALGISQLTRIDDYVKRRNHIADFYNKRLDQKVIKPWISPNNYSAYHLYIIRLRTENQKLRDHLFEILSINGINTNIHYIPMHFHPYHKVNLNSPCQFKNAELYYKTALSIPIYPTLQLSAAEKIAELINGSI